MLGSQIRGSLPHGLPTRAGDACESRRKASRVKRLFSIAAICAVFALTGCQDPNGAQSDPAKGLVRPATDIVIKSVRTFAPNDSVAGSNDEYYVITFTFTNDQGLALAPRIDHFVVQDIQNRRYFGVETGNVALVGISNYEGVLKVGDSHDYTVGFRVAQNTTGTLFYDNSF
jgi:hypothetical protein